MTPGVLLRSGASLFRIPLPDGPIARLPLDADPVAAARVVVEEFRGRAGDAIVRWVRSSPGPSSSPHAGLRARLAADGLEVAVSSPADLRAAVRRLTRSAAPDRSFLLALGRQSLARALASEEQTLIALAREEERLERALVRETGTLDQFLVGPSGPLAEYRVELERYRGATAEHLARLVERLEQAGRRWVPNLTELVGPRVAARLVALAGSRSALARMPAARLQLLGARRRPPGGHGPRFGVIYRASRMAEVPIDRQGRMARSLAALAVIAARADEFGQRDIAAALVSRRDRRLTQLARQP